jgi:O-antigen ligase
VPGAEWWSGQPPAWAPALALIAAFALFMLPAPALIGLTGALLVILLAARWPTLAAGLTPLAFPFTFYPRDFGIIGFAPAEAATLMLAAATGLRLLVVLLQRRWSWRALIAHRPPVWLAGAGAALLAIATLSLATVADPTHRAESLREYRTVIVGPLLYGALAWLHLRRAGDLLLALLALGAAAAVAGLGAAVQLALGLGGISAEGVRRAVWPYRHANNLALFVGRAGAACLGLALGLPGGWPRRLALLLGAGAALGMSLTFSRGGWLSILVVAIVLAFVFGRRWLAVALIVGGLALLVLLPLTGVDRLSVLLDAETGSAALRLEIWRSTTAMLVDHPLTGVGLDQFLYQYQRRYVVPEAWGERFTAHPHNLLLDFWVRLGILGLVWAVCVHGLALGKAAVAARRLPAPRQALAAAAGAVLLYGLLHGLVDNGFFLPDLAFCFWLALIVLARALEPAAEEARRDESAAPRV